MKKITNSNNLGKMSRREMKRAVRNIAVEIYAGLEPDDDMARAARVRALCPCEFPWNVPLWDIIFAACDDSSPHVRVEALHVIEDAKAHGLKTAGGMARLYAARRDAEPVVRHFANDILGQEIRARRRVRNRKKDLLAQD